MSDGLSFGSGIYLSTLGSQWGGTGSFVVPDYTQIPYKASSGGKVLGGGGIVFNPAGQVVPWNDPSFTDYQDTRPAEPGPFGLPPGTTVPASMPLKFPDINVNLPELNLPKIDVELLVLIGIGVLIVMRLLK